jgi:hypothetical protein
MLRSWIELRAMSIATMLVGYRLQAHIYGKEPLKNWKCFSCVDGQKCSRAQCSPIPKKRIRLIARELLWQVWNILCLTCKSKEWVNKSIPKRDWWSRIFR